MCVCVSPDRWRDHWLDHWLDHALLVRILRMALIKSQWLNGVSVNGTTTDPEEVTGATRFGVSMETTGGPSTAHVTLQGSIDGSHWFSLVGLNTAATVGGYNSDIDPVAVPIAWIRLLMDALTGGSSPTVSASAIAV